MYEEGKAEWMKIEGKQVACIIKIQLNQIYRRTIIFPRAHHVTGNSFTRCSDSIVVAVVWILR